jgi:phenylpropionate dioxygenase-like ring-hydroxylating dioxygenase large terminal subunit
VNLSVAVPRPAWYPAATSTELGRRKPVSLALMDSPLVAFRDRAGRAGVLADRCPHRNAPLSLGRVSDEGLQCPYHGWCFAPGGECTSIPGIAVDVSARRGVPSHATVERDGIVWFWSEPDEAPVGQPYALPDLGPRSRQVSFHLDIEATMHATIENTLDVPHTAFLHRGLLRGAAPSEIRAVRRAIPGGVEVQYFGEPFGIGFIRPPSDTELEHFDRFLLPCIAQVEYRAGPWLQIVNTVVHLPMSATRTRTWFVLRAASEKLPSRLVETVIRLQGPHVAKQDARMLAAQTGNVQRFGGESYSSTEMDLFGTAVWRLLRAAEKGETPPEIAPREIVFRA